MINVQVSSLRPREDAERLMGLERKMAEQDAADLHAKSVSGGDATPGKMMRFGAFLGCSGDRIPLASVQNVQP